MPSQIKELLSSMASRGVDPFPTFKFHVEVGELVTAAFTECTGLEMSTEVFEYKEGGLNAFVHKFPGRTMFGNVTLKKGFALTNDLFQITPCVDHSLYDRGTRNPNEVEPRQGFPCQVGWAHLQVRRSRFCGGIDRVCSPWSDDRIGKVT